MWTRLNTWLQKQAWFHFALKVATLWGRVGVARHAAAIAFFSLLTLAPLLMVITGVLGSLLGAERVVEQILKALEQTLGAGASRLVKQLLTQTLERGSGTTATLVGLLLAFWGASGLLQALKSSLDEVWQAPPYAEVGVLNWLLTRLIASGAILILVGLMGASLVLELVLTAIRERMPDHLPLGYWLGYAANRALLPVMLWLGISLLYWWLPARRPRWRVAMGTALVATVLLILMRSLVSWYLTTTGIATLYGSAGSVVVLLLGVYFSAQVFFLGAILGVVVEEGVSFNPDER